MSLFLKALPAMAITALGSGQSFHAYLASGGDRDSGGIHQLVFDAEAGRFSELQRIVPSQQPFFMALHPSAELLYAAYNLPVETGDPGHVVSYSINPETHALSRIDKAPTGGRLPLHLSLHPSGSHLLAANYQTPTVASLELLDAGQFGQVHLAPPLDGSSIHPQRQDKSYPHSITFDPRGRFAYACDRGSDRIYRFAFDSASGKLHPVDPPYIATRPGAGPRHMAFHPDGRRAYVVNEINGSVTAYQADPATGELVEGPSYPSVPQSFLKENLSAEIAVHPNGAFLYASNRGHDSIAVFAIGSGTALKPLQRIPSGGEHPRYFTIDPTGRWLLVSNRHSDRLSVFRLDPASGRLEATAEPLTLQQPLQLLFLQAAAKGSRAPAGQTKTPIIP